MPSHTNRPSLDTPTTAGHSDRGEAAFVDSADLYVETSTEPGGPAGKDATKEQAVKQKRVWVRVTRLCNQRCTFCLDSWNQNGTYVPLTELTRFVKRGHAEGGQRLILSGGEATVHPDFIKLIRYGRKVGYEWIQTVTNGQMFAYPEFARQCKVSGIDEVTFSMHGHNAKLHDRLVGLPGAFERANQGIRNLQALGGVVVNVDVVINKSNVRHLREILDFYFDMGIREFDLLYIVPFGRGFEEYRDQLFFDPTDHFDDFQRAFEVAARPGVFIWTNRFPVQFLEGYERLIQDPHKLHYEVNGGRHNFDGYLQTGTPPDCYGERCDHCFLQGLCRDSMFRYRNALHDGRFRHAAVDLDGKAPTDAAQARFTSQPIERVDLMGGTPAERSRWVADQRPSTASLRVAAESTDAVDALAPGLDESDALVVSEPAALARALAHSALPRVVCDLTRDDDGTAAWLLAHPDHVKDAASRLTLRLTNHEYLSGSRATDPEPEVLRALAALGVPMVNVPACLAGDAARPGEHDVLERTALDTRGEFDTDAYVHRYITGEYYAKSRRCGDCVYQATCNGMHINYVRNYGLKSLQPIESEQKERKAG